MAIMNIVRRAVDSFLYKHICLQTVRIHSSSIYRKDTTLEDKTPLGRFSDSMKQEKKEKSKKEEGGEALDHFAPFPEATNPETGEIGGPTGPEPTRYGDWERKGRVTDF